MQCTYIAADIPYESVQQHAHGDDDGRSFKCAHRVPLFDQGQHRLEESSSPQCRGRLDECTRVWDQPQLKKRGGGKKELLNPVFVHGKIRLANGQ